MNEHFGNRAWAETQAMHFDKPKPTVRYIGPAEERAPNRARLTSINHRNPALNGFPIITSRVLGWHRASGRIETLNTMYVPIEDTPFVDEMVARVGAPLGVTA